jgi:hypothetical protein
MLEKQGGVASSGGSYVLLLTPSIKLLSHMLANRAGSSSLPSEIVNKNEQDVTLNFWMNQLYQTKSHSRVSL